ncbi:MAG: hypothetical protein FJX75_30230, partial [Armatimonadetes bacterium]|nr:hypothetical protein [Armatimonadota bacterium]
MTDTGDLTTARGRRACILDMCRRRQRPGTGSDAEALMEEGLRMEWPDLGEVFGPVPWAVIGAVATRHYMPERATQDLDVIVAAEHAGEAERRLREAGWEESGRLTIGGSVWRSPEGRVLDLVECAEPWCEAAIAEAQTNRDRQGLPIVPLAYLVLTKLRASRGRDQPVPKVRDSPEGIECGRLGESGETWAGGTR